MGIGNDFETWAMSESVPARGMFGCCDLPLWAGLWDDNGTLKAIAAKTTGTMGFTRISTSLAGIAWDAAATQTDKWVFPWKVPQDYRRDTGRTDEGSKIVLRAKVRKNPTGVATDNDNLRFVLDVAFHSSNIDNEGAETDGDSAVTTQTGIDGTLMDGTALAPDLATSLDAEKGFRWMEWDISAALSAAELASIQAGASMTLNLYPHETVGADQQLEVVSAEIVYTRHLMPENDTIKHRATDLNA